MTNFPKIRSDYSYRSLGIAIIDRIDIINKASSKANSTINSASTAIIYTLGSAETIVSQVTDKI